MIMTIEKRICDVCKKEVQDFAGTFFLRYTTDGHIMKKDVRIMRNDICIDCCKKLDKLIMEALKKLSNSNKEK